MVSSGLRSSRAGVAGVVAVLVLVAAVACAGNELELVRASSVSEPEPMLARVIAVSVAADARPSIARAPLAVAAMTVESETKPASAPMPAPDSVPPPAGFAESPPTEPTGPTEPTEPSGVSVPEIVATAREVIIYAEPTRSSSKLGYLRLGARIRRAVKSAGHDGCALGWYRIAPEGFVCVGGAASLDENHPLAELARTRPDRDAPLPYAYGRARPVPPPLYTHLPTHTEMIALEGSAVRDETGFADLVSRPAPDGLADGQAMPMPFGYARPPSSATPRALQNSGFALLDVFEHAGRRFGVTTDLELVPLDRLTRVEASAFHGVVLDDAMTLPLVFVRARHAALFAGSPEHGFRPARPLGYREALSLGERSVKLDGVRYLETRAGEWLRDTDLVHVEAAAHPPAGVRGERTWIHVSIEDQTLVAYVGERPVYATLVSTGADGMGDPETTHSTPRGEFVIHTKHLSATMSGDEVGDEFDLRDVPYVEYFTQGFAFHAAYWHDAFGAPHSHGCVNLSPLDARWLFHFTEPAVPQGWHGAFSREGTLVSITP
jgi:L,D-transpeptidase catalytic domain